MENTLPDFGQKIVYVFFDSGSAQSRAAVASPRFEIQGGQLFLVGRGFTSHAWGSDVPIAIAWSKVQWYSVFESAEAFAKAEAYARAKPGFFARRRMK